MSVRFRFGWVDAGPSPDILAQSTMATLSVEAGGATVTSVLDRGNRIYSNQVVVPLFSVAEWLVTNWWHLWYEIEDIGEQRPDFAARHNLAFAADGFVLPSLTMTTASGEMQLRWAPYKPQHARIEFVDEGNERVARDELETELRNLIDSVIERLYGRPDTAPAADNLARVWNAVNGLDADELEFSRAAALLGLDPFDVQDDVADGIVAFWARTEPSLREDALARRQRLRTTALAGRMVRGCPTRSRGRRARQRLGRAFVEPCRRHRLGLRALDGGLHTCARDPRTDRRQWRAVRLSPHADAWRFPTSRRSRRQLASTGWSPLRHSRLRHGAQRPIRHTVSDRARPRRIPGPLHTGAQACSAPCPLTSRHNLEPSPRSFSHRQRLYNSDWRAATWNLSERTTWPRSSAYRAS